MSSVYKYPVPLTEDFIIDMPLHSKPLCVQVQCGEPFLWALVQPDNPIIQHRKFRLAGTGHSIDLQLTQDLQYIGTFQLDGGSLVFHLFVYKIGTY